MRARVITFVIALLALSITAAPAFAAPKKAQVRFSTANYSVAENAGTFKATVLRSGSTSSTATVTLAIDPSTTATGADYTIGLPAPLTPANSVTLTFAPGVTKQDITGTVVDNSTANAPNKKLVFKISSPNANTQIKGATGTVTIIDNEGPGTLDFSSATYSVVAGAGVASFSVIRIGATTLRVSVDYAANAVGSTASGLTDYTPITPAKTLTFNPGEVSKTFQVPITDDGLAESAATVNLVLSNPKNLTTPAQVPQVGPNTPAVLTINDDDVSTYSFQSTLFSVNENDLT